MSNMGQRTPTEKLIHRLRLMADAGGMLSRDRRRTVIEAADRLDELNDIVLAERDMKAFPDDGSGGDANEEH